MTYREHLEKLIKNSEQRKWKLEQQNARLGYSADPSISLEIEEIEETIKKSRGELDELRKQADDTSVSLPEWLVMLGKSEIGGSGPAGIEISVSLDLLDAATKRCLPNSLGFLDFYREVDAPHIVYRLRQDELGDLGEIRLSKLGNRVTLLEISSVPRPTDEEIKNIIPSSEIPKNISEVRESLHQRKKKHRKKVVSGYFSLLSEDGIRWRE